MENSTDPTRVAIRAWGALMNEIERTTQRLGYAQAQLDDGWAVSQADAELRHYSRELNGLVLRRTEMERPLIAAGLLNGRHELTDAGYAVVGA